MTSDRRTIIGPPSEGFRETDEAGVPKTKYATGALVPEELKRKPVVEADDTTVDVVPVENSRNGAEVRTVSSTGGEKGQKLARFDLIPVGPLTELAKHYGRGARKYADRNWEKGYEWSKNYAALQRHLFAFWDGEDIDEETGTPHIVAVAWHAFALAEFMNTHPEFDDRPKRG